MVNLIARRAVFKTKAGGTLRVTQTEARVLKALKLADDAPADTPRYAASVKKTKAATYKRRDMVAEPAADPVEVVPAAAVELDVAAIRSAWHSKHGIKP